MDASFFTDGPFYRKLVRLALPISLQALLVALVAVCGLLLYALRGQSGRALELVASEYP